MRTKKLWWIAGVLLTTVAALSVMCSSGGSHMTLNNAQLTVLYSSNVGGIIEACGCRPPMGGLARRATITDGVRAENRNLLVVDSGGLLFDRSYLYEPYDYINRLNAKTVIAAMRDMGIDAINVSTFDLADGVDALEAYDTERTPWVSANIVWKENGEPVFTTDRIVSAGDLSVGVFGLVTEAYRGIPMFDDESPLTALDPVTVAKNEVKKLSPDTHLIVALTYMDYDQARELAHAVPGINVIVVSHTGPHTPSSSHSNFHAFVEDGTIIVRCPDGGRVYGRLDIDVVDGSLDFVESTQPVILLPDGSVKPPERSQFRNQLYDLGSSVPRKRVIQELVDATNDRVSAYRDSLALDE